MFAEQTPAALCCSRFAACHAEVAKEGAKRLRRPQGGGYNQGLKAWPRLERFQGCAPASFARSDRKN